MSRKTSHYGFLPLLMLVVALLGVAPGEAVSFALADRDREQAIRAGKKSIVLEEFGAEWRLRDASGQTLVVMTPFHRLALAARNSAFRGEEIKPRDIESVLKEYVRMDRECTDKAKDLLEQRKLPYGQFGKLKRTLAEERGSTLMAGSLAVKASFVQNERTALREEDGKYAARCIYVFPADGLDPRGRVTLVVRDAEEREVAKFTVDLAAMR